MASFVDQYKLLLKNVKIDEKLKVSIRMSDFSLFTSHVLYMDAMKMLFNNVTYDDGYDAYFATKYSQYFTKLQYVQAQKKEFAKKEILNVETMKVQIFFSSLEIVAID